MLFTDEVSCTNRKPADVGGTALPVSPRALIDDELLWDWRATLGRRHRRRLILVPKWTAHGTRGSTET